MRVSVKWLAAVPQRGAQVLSRLASGVFTQRARTLADGSYLVTLRPKGQDAITVRVIEYRLRPEAASDLALLPVSRTSRPAEPQRVHRLVTTLLDPVQAPALDLILLYHERWEIELVIDEIKTHQRLSPQPLRSKSPELLYQELYGLLLAHYAVRAWMHQSAVQADLDPDRLSFTHALHVLDTACYEFAIVATDDLPRLHQRLLGFLARPQIAASPSSLALLSSRRQTGLFLLSSQATLASLLRLEKRFLSGPSSYLKGIDPCGRPWVGLAQVPTPRPYGYPHAQRRFAILRLMSITADLSAHVSCRSHDIYHAAPMTDRPTLQNQPPPTAPDQTPQQCPASQHQEQQNEIPLSSPATK